MTKYTSYHTVMQFNFEIEMHSLRIQIRKKRLNQSNFGPSVNLKVMKNNNCDVALPCCQRFDTKLFLISVDRPIIMVDIVTVP